MMPGREVAVVVAVLTGSPYMTLVFFLGVLAVVAVCGVSGRRGWGKVERWVCG
jgi:hypothetical protein